MRWHLLPQGLLSVNILQVTYQTTSTEELKAGRGEGTSNKVTEVYAPPRTKLFWIF